ncbi:MAG: hypothetical protein V3T70_06435, partial [Phycisphaerae bacterium]
LTAPTLCGGDCNADMVRDGSDLQTFTTCFISGIPGCECADFDQNGAIEPADLTAMVAAMLSSPACP